MPQTIVSENFTKANSTTTMGTPQTTPSSNAWVNNSGTWGILSNRGYVATTSAGNDSASVDSTYAGTTGVPVTISGTAAIVDSTNTGIVARLTDGSNYLLSNDQVAGQVVYKNVAGVLTQLGSTSTGRLANGDILQFYLSGNSITFRVNAVDRVTATDAFNNTATKHGLRGQTADPGAERWSLFTVTIPGIPGALMLTGAGAT